MNTLKILKSESGSSSVLVILIMVTLVIFGVMAMMSAYTEIKLARKNVSHIKNYYESDMNAERLLSIADKAAKKSHSSQELISRLKDDLGRALISESKSEPVIYPDKLRIAMNQASDIGFSEFPVELYAVVGNHETEDDVRIELRILLRPSTASRGSAYKIVEWKQIPSDIVYPENNNIIWGD